MIKTVYSRDLNIRAIFERGGSALDVSHTVAGIIADVRERGDAALLDYARKYDGAEIASLEVTRDEWDAAFAEVEPEFIAVLERAAANIETYHRNQIRSGFVVNGADGTVTGQKITPVARAGLYIPGGTAAYPSSALMNAIPAKIAGVPEIIMTTPPGRDGGIKNPYILAAARIAGVDRVFKTGGAQAVAAMAFGTQSVPRVDKIVGPGNAYVAEAKRQVFGAVGIDMVAGPSDVCVIADSTARADWVAADMLAQAEHDVLARAVLITPDAELARAVAESAARQIEPLPRRAIAEQSIKNNGLIIICESIAEAMEIANEIAPEHLELCVEDAFALLSRVRNAGSVFLGNHTPEAFGDYLAGPNHTLPTMGTARFASPLSVDDFVKKTAFTYFSHSALETFGADTVYFAKREGLTAHARSVTIRKEGGE